MPYPMTDKTLKEFGQGIDNSPPARSGTKRRLVLAISAALARAGWLLDRASVRVLGHLPEVDHSGSSEARS